ncbi:MAG: phosphoenolpyruvate synthase [Desulfatibacillaceae bacterium]
MSKENEHILWFDDLANDDVAIVGGKNASLGEMIGALKEEGIRVPDGFATTAKAYRDFIAANDLEERIRDEIEQWRRGDKQLDAVGEHIRAMFTDSEFPGEIEEAIRDAYAELSRKDGHERISVAVRSSATAEDLPDASFAGQQETYLNVRGKGNLVHACQRCFASLFTDRAISYREEKGFDHMDVALSVGVQKMVRSDKGAAGVMFSIDTETGFPDVVVINGSWGLGENVVQGSVTPDEFLVFKPLLEKGGFVPIIGKTLGAKEKKMIYATGGGKTTKNIDTNRDEQAAFVIDDDEAVTLARWAAAIERHYGKAMDIEWAKDGDTGKLHVVQARPETVQSNREAGTLKHYTLNEEGRKLVTGIAIGDAIAAGKVCRIMSAEDIDQFEDGSILVTEMTDPDWVPIMKRARGIIADLGGRTCHAAIVSRELGIPAVVGTGNGTRVLQDGMDITLSCAEGDHGFVYKGILDYEEKSLSLENVPKTDTGIMLNIASPDAAMRWWRLPAKGVGLLRMEFIINNIIQIHPMALVQYDQIMDQDVKSRIDDLTRGYDDKVEYFVDILSRGIARVAASQYPEPVILRMSDFKTNEYADLIGGEKYEPEEANPMLGFRGASRYYSDRYREGFALECRAVKRARDKIGMSNLLVMIPFCRTPEEADKVLEVLGENGLRRGENGLEVYVMAEIPSNITLADQFAERFDGFSIGSNDLTQLVLGVDRDSGILSDLFDERNDAVKRQIATLIEEAHKQGRKVGICGQAPSDYPEFAAFLVEQGIDTISLNPDSVLQVLDVVAEAEGKRGK